MQNFRKLETINNGCFTNKSSFAKRIWDALRPADPAEWFIRMIPPQRRAALPLNSLYLKSLCAALAEWNSREVLLPLCYSKSNLIKFKLWNKLFLSRTLQHSLRRTFMHAHLAACNVRQEHRCAVEAVITASNEHINLRVHFSVSLWYALQPGGGMLESVCVFRRTPSVLQHGRAQSSILQMV